MSSHYVPAAGSGGFLSNPPFATMSFNSRLEHVPQEWRGPLVDVVDTFETLKIGLSESGIDDTACLIEAVKLVLDRRDKSTLRKQALAELERGHFPQSECINIIRLALEALPE